VDKKKPITSTINFFLRITQSMPPNPQNTPQNRYPFGSSKIGWKNEEFSYSYSFNGMEKDDELKGDGNSLDFGARIYDSRLGRLYSRDLMEKKFSSFTPYLFTENNPIF
jgi:RHS repeat-associated protein